MILAIPWAITAFAIYALPIGAMFEYNELSKFVAGVVAAILVWVVFADLP